jgi:hypothetical protein
MLFDSQVSQAVKISSVPREVCVSVAQARHQSTSSAMEDSDLGVFAEFFDVRYSAYIGDGLTCSWC